MSARSSGPLLAPYCPVEVDRITQVFPGSVAHLMPAYDRDRAIPRGWIEFQNDWFFLGLKDPEFVPSDGIDPQTALTHLATIQRSFEPKHEHKEQAVAFLASLWFKKVRANGKTYAAKAAA